MTKEEFFKIKLGFFLAVCAAGLFAFFGRGSFQQVTVVFALNLWAGVLLLLFSAAAWVIARLKESERIRRAALTMLVTVGMLALQILSIPAGQMLLAHDVREAQAYCESLIPILDQIKEKQGAYPKSQEKVVNGDTLPRLLRADRFYWSNGKTFTLAFRDPAGMLNYYELTSAQRKWKRFD